MKDSIITLIFILIIAIVFNSCFDSETKEYKPTYSSFEKRLKESVDKHYFKESINLIDTFINRYQYDTTFIRQMDSLKQVVENIRDSLLGQREQAINNLKKLRGEKDEFNNTTIYTHPSSPKYVDRNGFFLIFTNTSGNFTSPLTLSVQYYADDWLFIKYCEILVDGDKYTYAPGRFERDNNSKVWEYNRSIVTPETRQMLERIADSKDSKIRLIGQQYHKDITITKRQKEALKLMLDTHYGLTIAIY